MTGGAVQGSGAGERNPADLDAGSKLIASIDHPLAEHGPRKPRRSSKGTKRKGRNAEAAARLMSELTADERQLLVNLLTDRRRADSFSAAFSRYGQLGMGSLA